IQPADAVLDAGFLVELLDELDGLRGLAGVERDLLAVLVHDGHAVGPQEGVEPGVVVREAMPHGHTERMARGRELDAGFQEFVPGLWETLASDLVEPIPP